MYLFHTLRGHSNSSMTALNDRRLHFDEFTLPQEAYIRGFAWNIQFLLVELHP